MVVNLPQFDTDGFLILRGLIPPATLKGMRTSVEKLLDRKKMEMTRAGKDWKKYTPGIAFYDDSDASTANTLEFGLQDETLGVSRQLMRAPEASVLNMSCMCSDGFDHGPARWHRDIHPGHPAPLCGLQANARDHGPGYVQWNIALCDDSVFWVVPGSHCRINTVAEDQQLLKDSRVALPDGEPVHLKAGDAIVYSHLILHWGNYGAKLRRTMMQGYRSFGGGAFSNEPFRPWSLEKIRHLAPWAQQRFETLDEVFNQEVESLVSFFRSMIDKDADAFRTVLSRLHCGQKGRMTTIVILSKFAERIRKHHLLDVSGLSESDRSQKIKKYWGTSDDSLKVASQFTAAESETLWNRFAVLDEKLKLEKPKLESTSQGPQYHEYRSNDMPVDFDVSEFIASWDESRE